MRASSKAAVKLGVNALVLLGLMVAAPAWALHRETPGAVQISSGVSHTHPSGRSWGNFFTFASSQDLAGTGNTTPQIFVFNLAYYDCAQGTTEGTTPCPAPGTPYIRQVTSGPGAPANPTIGDIASGNQDQWIAFDALGSFDFGGALAPLSGAAATKRQIFMRNLRTNEVRRVTASADGDSVRPSANVLAGVVVFESTASLLGGLQNPAGVSQVYVYERAGGIIRRLSVAAGGQAAGPSTRPVANQDGKRIAFESTADLLGNGANTGVSQIYYVDYDKVNHTGTLYRLTNGNGPSRNAYIAENSPVVVFDSAATNLPGSTGGAGRRVVLANVSTPANAAATLTELTPPSIYGDCSFPTLNPGAKVTQQGVYEVRVPMICTGDPLDNDTTGNRVFVYDTSNALLFQITGAGDVQGPLSANLGQWFLTLSTSSDLTGDGVCGYQIYTINYNYLDNPHSAWVPAQGPGQVPPDAIEQSGSSVIGLRAFDVANMASNTSITTRDGTLTTPVSSGGSVGLDIGAPNGFNGEAAITVPQDRVLLPPVPVAGFGAICFQAAGAGQGTLDCDGGAAGGNVTVAQDHNTDDSDPSCTLGCREDDLVCQGSLPGPHLGESVAVCNGPVNTTFGGTYAPGGVRVSVPVNFSFSVNAGPDGVFCNGNDTYSTVQNMPALLWLTTGTATGRILDRDNVLGLDLEAPDAGVALDCNRLRAGDLAGAHLVGTVPILDVPNVPGLRDVIVGFDFEAAPSAPNACGASCNTAADCDDGNACNGAEVCGANKLCQSGTPLTCDDGNVCNGAETCDPDQGCVAGVACNDGNPCNGEETCSQQTGCQAGSPVVCTDGNACNGVETCNPANGQCVGGQAPSCNDGNSCTTDMCDPQTGCTFMNNTDPCNDGSACTENDTCGGGSCAGTPTPAAVACNAGDGNACNGTETCNPSSGACEATPLDCNDGNVCTTDSCAPAFGCQYVNNTNPCSDGNLCTTGDVCSNGACVATPTVCGDGNACNGIETCNPSSGACQGGTPPSCDDGDPCTTDDCSEAVGCTIEFNTAPCDDGNACTTGDTCNDGTCEPGGAVQCDDGNLCTGTETCDPEEGCHAGTPPSCNDGNACTDDTCTPGSGCSSEAVVCDDNNACTDDSCDPVTGCHFTTKSCDDGNPCTADSCTPEGCLHEMMGDQQPCDDGNACTTGDVCTAGVCGGTGAVACGDSNVCNGAEACNPQTGVCEAGTPLTCDDGDACTIDAECSATEGCTYQRVPNFVVCRLTSLLDLVRATSPIDLGGKKRHGLLVKRATAARKKAQLGLIGTGNRAYLNLRRADRRIQSFMGLLQQGMLRGKVDSARGNALLALAADTDSELVALMRAVVR